MERGRERWEGIEGWALWSSDGGLVHFSGAGGGGGQEDFRGQAIEAN
jgi:hypothetical protein